MPLPHSAFCQASTYSPSLALMLHNSRSYSPQLRPTLMARRKLRTRLRNNCRSSLSSSRRSSSSSNNNLLQVSIFSNHSIKTCLNSKPSHPRRILLALQRSSLQPPSLTWQTAMLRTALTQHRITCIPKMSTLPPTRALTNSYTQVIHWK
jgi:hypothetical protein